MCRRVAIHDVTQQSVTFGDVPLTWRTLAATWLSWKLRVARERRCYLAPAGNLATRREATAASPADEGRLPTAIPRERQNRTGTTGPEDLANRGHRKGQGRTGRGGRTDAGDRTEQAYTSRGDRTAGPD